MHLREAVTAALARLGGPRGLALGFMLLLAAARFPGLTAYAQLSLPVLRLWPDGEAQRRAAAVDYPYDLLRQADALLPPDAAVLLVTAGRDVRGGEYTTYHRALYYLAPRPVWCLSPAPPDGTWEARWWISAPLTAESVRAAAASRGAAYVLAYGVLPLPGLAAPLAEWQNGYLAGIAPGAALVDTGGPRREDAGRWWPVQLAAALAVIFAAGYALLGGLGRWGLAARGVEAAALAWMLGAGGVTLGMFWLDAAGLSLRWQAAVITLLVLAALAVRFGGQLARLAVIEGNTRNNAPGPSMTGQPAGHGPAGSRKRQGATVISLLPLVILILFSGLATLLALGRPLTVWDSWANWGVKARTIFLEGGITAAVTADPARAVTHLDYPLMLPLLQTWLYSWLGVPDDRFAGLIPLLFYLALAGIVYGGARRLGVAARLRPAVAVAASVIPHVALLAGFAFADVPLAALAAVAAVYLAAWLREGKGGVLAVAATAAGLLPWLKREGIVLAAALGVAALIAGRGSRRARVGIITLAGAAAALAGPWWLLAAQHGRASADFLPPSAATLAANAGRLPVVAQMALTNLLGADWLYLWPLAALFGLRLVQSRRGAAGAAGGEAGLLPLAALLYLGAMGAAFVFSAYVPFQQHVASSWYRLAAHVTALPLLWLAAPGDSAAAQPGGDP